MRNTKEKLKERTDDSVNINVRETWEMEWWPWRLGVSKPELLRAVKSVGPALDKVRNFLIRKRKI